MKINLHKKGSLEYIVIDEMYSNKELAKIKKELYKLLPKANTVEVVESAIHDNGAYKKDCVSLWLDTYYSINRNESDILKLNRKLFSAKIISPPAKFNAFFKHIPYCTFDSTLINYYKSNEKYVSHTDNCILTALTLFELGTVKNGGISFTDYDEHIEFKDNRVVIFPGCVSHATGNILTEKNSYRVSMAQFLNYKII
jgi:hypothetical protein